MKSLDNFVVPERKTEWDIFKEIVVFVILNSVLLSFIFIVVMYMSEFLPVELYPLFLACAGVFTVYRVIFKNRIVSEDRIHELIHQCSVYPKLKQNVVLIINQNTFIRISNLLEMKAVALEELQCMKVMHQTALLLSDSVESGNELKVLGEQIDAYSNAIDSLDEFLKSTH